MKKFFILCLMAFVMCVNANAQEVIGFYHSDSEEFNIEACYIQNDLLVLIQVLDLNGSKSEVYIGIHGAEDIQKFTNALHMCKTKYNEWNGVAKSNNITDFNKVINVTFPNVIICKRGYEWYISNKLNCIVPMFFVSENDSYISLVGKTKDYKNEYIDIEFACFLCPQEVDELINVLNINNIKSALNKYAQRDNLFK